MSEHRCTEDPCKVSYCPCSVRIDVLTAENEKLSKMVKALKFQCVESQREIDALTAENERLLKNAGHAAWANLSERKHVDRLQDEISRLKKENEHQYGSLQQALDRIGRLEQRQTCEHGDATKCDICTEPA